MACKQHPDRESVAICVTCREELCEQCRRVGPDGKSYCAAHLPASQPQPQPTAAAAPQPSAGAENPQPAAPVMTAAGASANESTALAALCCLCWILTPVSFVIPVIVLATDYKNSRYMRYHGYNGLFWGIAVVLVMGLLRFGEVPVRILGLSAILRAPLGLAWWLVGPAALILSIVFAVKANNREDVRIPVISDLAIRQS